MSAVAIRVQGLGKRYRLGVREPARTTWRETLARAATGPVRRLRTALRRGSPAGADESIWALEEVTFEVDSGEVLGVIGRNGAGKSTLLKVLSRITEPTTGRAEIHGRVASLLEVGTGFHPELTGRENVFLNGSILGMRRTEIQRKFDEIVAFAEVERFLDTQVKHYSSGMYLRLAFAVAAHLEPEVLLVDEVLAVGDASFQRKCLGKMSDVARLGRTVLFVSHNLAAISRLCDRCILLDGGRLEANGTPAGVIRAYSERTGEARDAAPGAPGAALTLRDVRLGGGDEVLHAGQPWRIAFTIETAEALAGLTLGVALLDDQGRLVVHARIDPAAAAVLKHPGSHRVRVDFPPVFPAPGLYSLEIKLVGEGLGTKCRIVSDPRTVQVVNEGLDDFSLAGIICPPSSWRVEPAATHSSHSTAAEET